MSYSSWADAGDDDNHFDEHPDQHTPPPVATQKANNNKHEVASNEKVVEHTEPKDSVNSEQKPQRPPRDLSTLKEPYTIWLGNLEYEVTKEKIESFFEGKGCKVKDVRIVKEKYHPFKPKGIAYVEFKDFESIENSLKLHGEVIIGREIKIDIAEERLYKEKKLSISTL